MRTVAEFLGSALNKPVLDRTQLTNSWDVELKWETSPVEQLALGMDRRIYSMAATNSAMIIAGKLPEELRSKLTDQEYDLLRSELAKPDEEQFQPAPANVIKAAREQLGLDLKLENQVVPVVVIRKAE